MNRVAPPRNAFLTTHMGYEFGENCFMDFMVLPRYTSFHIHPIPSENLKCHDMISASSTHHSTNGLVGGGLVWWFDCQAAAWTWGMVDSGGLMPFLLDTQYRSHPVIAEATFPAKTGGGRMMLGKYGGFWGGWKAGDSRLFLGVKEWIDEFHTCRLWSHGDALAVGDKLWCFREMCQVVTE